MLNGRDEVIEACNSMLTAICDIRMWLSPLRTPPDTAAAIRKYADALEKFARALESLER